jgi:flagellar hook-length control protein FliK
LNTFDRFVQHADDEEGAPSQQAPDANPVAASLLYQPQAAVVPATQESTVEAVDEPVRDLSGVSAGRPRFAQEPAVEPSEEDGVQAPEEAAAHPATFEHALRTVSHEAAPQLQQTAQTEPPVSAVAVSQELSQAITHGAKRVQMRIVPEGLGELDIKVQMTGQQVHLTIRGDAPELAQLLTHKVEELRQDLQQQGLSLGAMDFGALGASANGSSMSQDGRSQQSRLADDGQGGLQRLAGAKESTSTGAPRSRPRGAGPSHRIIDVVL